MNKAEIIEALRAEALPITASLHGKQLVTTKEAFVSIDKAISLVEQLDDPREDMRAMETLSHNKHSPPTKRNTGMNDA